MNSPSEDIKDMLVSSESGLSLTFATNLFIAVMPDMPDLCACIYDTGGIDPDFGVDDYYRPTIQVRVRGKVSGYQQAYTLINDIGEYLHRKNNETWNSTRYIAIWRQGDIFHLGVDDRNRPILTLNFRMHRTTG